VVRDQMVGPWQIPVADCAVTTSSFDSFCGEAMSIGERTPLALIDAPASGRMAVGEAITNIAAARIGKLSDVKLSANWMCAAGHRGEDEKLYRTVEAIGMELCPALGITIPVGKDSMSMRTAWQERGKAKAVTSPLSLIISAFAPVVDVRLTLTPELKPLVDHVLLFVDLGAGRSRLGGSILAQTYNQIGDDSPDVDDAERLAGFFNAMQESSAAGRLLAYHDRSDGGLLTTLAEMAFAGRCGLVIDFAQLPQAEPLALLFSEELGAVVQVAVEHQAAVEASFAAAGVHHVYCIGRAQIDQTITLGKDGEVWLKASRAEWQTLWAETSYRMQALRDNADCALQEHQRIAQNDPGLSAKLNYNPADNIAAPYIKTGVRPQVAILREQGVNSQLEMAAAFERAGFSAVDVHMSDILAGRVSLQQFKGLAGCGGFSYG
ncbi:MAG: phosphoribosylformylglycinamidine synthase, partial [Sphingobacteriales bacterium]